MSEDITLNQNESLKLPPFATQNEDGSVTLKIRRPFTGVDGLIEDLHFKRLNGKQMLDNLSKNDGNKTMISVSTGVPIPLLERMDGADAFRALNVINFILEIGLETGQS